MTLGSFGHLETMPYYLDEHFGVAVRADDYDSAGARFFRLRGDVDNDGKWNVEEWRNAVKTNGGVVDMNAVAVFVQAAMDRESDGWDVPDGLGPGEFIFEDVVYEVGSFEHMVMAAAATGAFSEYLPKTTVTLSSTAGDTRCAFAAYVVDPPGFETVPLPSGAFTCALGRAIRVEVQGDTRWFTTWYAPNTLIHGSTEESEVFRLGNLNQVVRASKRGYESVAVVPSSRAAEINNSFPRTAAQRSPSAALMTS